MKCPHCDQINMIFQTDIAESRGTGNAPYAIMVLLISCPSCSKVLGVLPQPQPERSRR